MTLKGASESWLVFWTTDNGTWLEMIGSIPKDIWQGLEHKFNSRRTVGQRWPDKALSVKSRHSNCCYGNMYQVNNDGLIRIILLHTKSSRY